MTEVRQNIWGLEWLVDEVESSLQEAYNALEAYLSDDSNKQQLQFCLNHLHQVSGSLKIVACHGGVLLVEEMELLVQAIADDDIHDISQSSELLVNAILKVPVYLRQILSNRRDEPAILLTSLNELRAVRKQSLATETSVFNPDLSILSGLSPNINPAPQSLNATIELLKKLRQIYQVALLGLSKKQESRKNLNFLRKVTVRLQELFANSQRQYLWRVSSAILQSLNSEQPQIGIAQRQLFWELDKELRLMIQSGAQGFNEPFPDNLLHNLLYYVLLVKAAQGDSSGDLVDGLYKDFKLDKALPQGVMSMEGGGLVPHYDRSVIETLSSSLSDEVDILKEKLERHLESDSPPTDVVSQANAGLKKINDTLAIVAYAPARQTALEISTQLEAYADIPAASRSELAPIVANVVLLDNIIRAWPQGDESNDSSMDDEQQTAYALDSAQQALIAEVHNNLEQIKDAIVAYISSRNDREHLREAPRLLNEIHYALAIIHYHRPATVIKGCLEYIKKELLNSSASPQWQDIDALADTIISVEYYLDSLGGAEILDSEKILNTAEEKLSSLGYAPQLETEVRLSDSQLPPTAGDGLLQAETLPDLPPNITDIGATPESDEPQTQDKAQPSTELSDEFSLELPPEPAEAEAVELSTDLEQAADQQADDEIDPEIREIFVEEAQEVLDSLQTYVPDWLAGDNNLLPDIRRSFHTLKGSGRMVKAEAIGELGWAVENVLNRVIDGQLTANDSINDLIQQTLELMPDMVSEFAQGQAHSKQAYITQLQENAARIALGEISSLATQLDTLAEVQPEPPTPAPTEEPDQHPEAAGLDEPSTLAVDNVADIAAGETIELDPDSLMELDTLLTQQESSSSEPAIHTQPAAELAEIQTPELETPPSESPEPASDLPEPGTTSSADLTGETPPAEDFSLLDSISPALPETASEAPQDAAPPEASSSDFDATLFTIFSDEAENYLSAMSDFVSESRNAAPFFSVPPRPLLRAVHTLKGSAHMSEVNFVADIASSLDHLLNEMADRSIAINERTIVLVEETTNLCHKAIAAMQQARQAVKPEGFDKLADELNELTATLEDSPIKPSVEPSGSDQALRGLMAEGMHHALGAGEMLDIWQFDNAVLQQQLPELLDELMDISSAAREARLPSLQLLCGSLIEAYHQVKQHESVLTNENILCLKEGHDLLLSMFDALAAYQEAPTFPDNLKSSLEAIATSAPSIIAPVTELVPDVASEVSQAEASEEDTEFEPFISGIEPLATTSVNSIDPQLDELPADKANEPESLSFPEPLDADLGDTEVLSPSTTPEPADLPAFSPTEQENQPGEAVDEELVAIFLEEADDLSEAVETAVVAWKEAPRNRDPIDDLKRALHTLKGGARMAGCRALGDLCHDFESEVIQSEPRRDQLESGFFDRMLKYCDQLLSELEQIKTGTPSGGFAQPIDDPETAFQTIPEALSNSPSNNAIELNPTATEGADISIQAPTPKPASAEPPAQKTAEVLPFAPGTSEAPAEMEAPVRQTPVQARPDTPVPAGNKPRFSEPQETIKIAAPVLDTLANLAGETSITRGRVEQQINQFHFSLDEMDATIARLQDQIRRLGLETEAQITFRQSQIESSGDEEGFDPLEMDRYSDLQQLTRALQESASDLQDIRETLGYRASDAEAVLVQQSRIHRDLQENLMLTRMVPFSRLVPRLRRIVRQVGGELDKMVDFNLEGVDGEMDRSVLEKVVPPLEHLIRNAIDHGIEPSEQREQSGKPSTGNIFLSFGREAGDIVIRLADDGRGLNLGAIRERAIQQNMLAEDSKISDHELMQFIFRPGFSTSKTVSQVSGRGVGMDVVNNDIRQLGGTVSINSRPGSGTEFVLRIPFTVSVNRALMIRNGGEPYAILLNSIDGVVNVTVEELSNFYKNPRSRLHYGGNQYEITYLGSLLQGFPAPSLEGFVEKAPLILLQGERDNFAVHVDVLEASQEVVVKSLGTQFGNVVGLSGVTVLGDGKVVAILDLRSLLRQRELLPDATAVAIAPTSAETPAHERTPKVLQPEMAIEEEAAVKDQEAPTIMIVDDSVTVRKVTTRFLEREGYRVITARDGVDALQVLQEELPTLMLLDIEMPRMDGFEVARQVRSSERLKDLPIIMITSRTGDKHRDKAQSIGVNHYMGKPYQEDALLSTIQELLA